MKTEQLKVSGMTCSGCVGSVTSAVRAVDGVNDVSVSLPTGKVTVSFEEHPGAIDRIKNAIRRAGYTVGHPDLVPKRTTGGCCCV